MADEEDTFLTRVEGRLSPRPSSRRWVGSPSKRGRFRRPKKKEDKEVKDLAQPVTSYELPTPPSIEVPPAQPAKPVYQEPQMKPASSPIPAKTPENVSAPIDEFKAVDVEFPVGPSDFSRKRPMQPLKYFPELEQKDSTSFVEETVPFYESKEALMEEAKRGHGAMAARVGKEAADARYGADFSRITEQVPIEWTTLEKTGGNLGLYHSKNPLIQIAKDAQVLTKDSTKDLEKEKKLLFDKVIGHEISHHALGGTQSSISDFLPSEKDIKELTDKNRKTHKIKNDREIGQGIGQLKRHLVQYARENPTNAKGHGFNISGEITPNLLDKMVEKGWPSKDDGAEYIPKLDNTWEGKEIRGLLKQLKGWKKLNPKKYESLIKEMTKLLPEYVKTDEPPKRFFPEQLT